MVQDILTGQDLSQITGKIVRDKVIQRLGDRAGDNFSHVKQAVKSALNAVLNSTSNPAPAPPPPQPKPQPDAATVEEHHGPQSPDKHDQSNEDHASPEPQQSSEDHASPETQPPVQEDDLFGDQPVKKSFVARKRARRVALSDSDSQSDSDSPAKARRKKASSATVSKRQRVVARRQRTAPNSRAARRLRKLINLCRKLGCTAPPSKLRGKGDEEKYNNVLSHLHSRGVDDPDPLRMTPNEIEKHRKRIARDKEMEGLDVRYVAQNLNYCTNLTLHHLPYSPFLNVILLNTVT